MAICSITVATAVVTKQTDEAAYYSIATPYTHCVLLLVLLFSIS